MYAGELTDWQNTTSGSVEVDTFPSGEATFKRAKSFFDMFPEPEKLKDVDFVKDYERDLLQQALGLDFFKPLLRNAQNIDQVLSLIKNHFFSEKLALSLSLRIEKIYKENYDPEELDPVSLESIKLFLEYCWKKGINTRPSIGATPNGAILATWENSQRKYTIRFMSKNNCHFFFKSVNTKEKKVYKFNELPLNP
jgi:hypothetical protein